MDRDIFSSHYGYGYDDIILLPDFGVDKINITSKLTKNIE